MADRDPRSPDPDDWFAGDERAPSRRARPATADDWIAEEPRSRAHAQRLAELLPGRWAPIAAGAAVLVIALIAWFAFSGGGSKPTQTATTNEVITNPATTPTTTPTAPSVPAPTTTLKPGDTGTQVKRLQRALASLGYTIGKVDGDYGMATKTALAQFQTSQKLTADGVFGPATRAALIKALSAG
jgi:hypothetical protein